MDETAKHPAKADEQPNSSGLVSGLAMDHLYVFESYSDLSSILARWYCFASTILQFGTKKEHVQRTHRADRCDGAEDCDAEHQFGYFPMFLFLPLHYCIDRKSPDQASPVKEVGICRSSSTAVYLPSVGTHLLNQMPERSILQCEGGYWRFRCRPTKVSIPMPH